MRALTATVTAICIAGFISLPVRADDATTLDASNADAVDTEKMSLADNSSSDGNLEGNKSDDNDSRLLAQNKKDPKAKTKKEPKAKSDAGKDGKKEPAKSASAKGGGNVDLATRLASFGVCTFIGAPIAVVRRSGIEIVQGHHDLIGDADTWWKKVGAVFPGVIAVPYGIVSGGFGGAVYAVKNAWVGSGDEPFGKEALSLGDIGN